MGISPPRNKNCSCGLPEGETLGVFMFDKTARYPNALYQAMGGKIWVGDSIVVTNEQDFPTNVMDTMIHMSQHSPVEPGVEQQLMLGSKSF